MPQQVYRLAIVFGLVIVGLVAARVLLVPKTFGEVGHYRTAAVDSIVKHPKKYAGHQTCTACHGNHASAPLNVKPLAPRERGFCPLCHAYNPSRPTGFPQIDPVGHNPMVPCVNCHDPHAPEPPVTPQECSACHGQIARQKAVSHHAALSCATCHESPEEHKIDPRAVEVGKPVDRGFCGGCHAQAEPGTPGIPQIDLSSHGQEYLCWQCHYPHFPEI
jgi:hypothetical protein